jgi:hypothetical protein
LKSTTGAIYLVEGRPSEKGRHALIQLKGTESIDILPKAYDIKSKVHEYGGGAASVGPDGSIIFTDSITGGVFSLTTAGEVNEIIKGDSKFRFADFNIHPSHHSVILAVQEEHREKEVINTIAIINAQTKEAHVTIQGADFYAHPKFSPDGKKLSWTQWNHPDMPWTGTELHIADWNNGSIEKATKVAGKARDESVVQPKWLFDGSLLFSSDRTGFWQLYRCDINSLQVEPLVIDGFQDADLGAREVYLGLCVSLNYYFFVY